MNIGQYPPPTHTLLHLSDTHLVENRRPLYGAVDSDEHLASLLERLRTAGTRLDAIVLTGDLADHGAPDAYERLRELIEPFAAEQASPIVWVMGNHDDREVFRVHLLDEPAGTSPIDRVHDVGGLRIVALDSTVPGSHHGEIDAEQLDWLRGVLATRAPHGTILALHHPPVPTTLPLLQMVDLHDAFRLEEVIRGTDVRGILAGHFHYPTHSTFAGVPVSVAAATCYTQDLVVPAGDTRAQNSGQGAALVHVHPDRIVHSDISMIAGETMYEIPASTMRSWVDALRTGQPLDTGLLDS
ncbi:phosphodiesterase [Salinibacterium sp. ZJ70]|uniref:phosphodiesterase n=1 Tax=Salinibacterium sp. ZJ70 TaxID=2708084 RepID=UPI00142384B3|nr:phosphodiesterase [Salinibacterium sp. ZJ70]